MACNYGTNTDWNIVLDTQSSLETNPVHPGKAMYKATRKSSTAPLYEFVACQDVSGTPDAVVRKRFDPT